MKSQLQDDPAPPFFPAAWCHVVIEVTADKDDPVLHHVVIADGPTWDHARQAFGNRQLCLCEKHRAEADAKARRTKWSAQAPSGLRGSYHPGGLVEPSGLYVFPFGDDLVWVGFFDPEFPEHFETIELYGMTPDGEVYENGSGELVDEMLDPTPDCSEALRSSPTTFHDDVRAAAERRFDLA